ncbi:putative cytochrome P450 [Nocardia nova SH22a]|uniref:Putative cytochrome P450 n=1 Tax=Nocardia nova SH22a TaxID=1415166 RepID=W5TLV2_9NOCA|nr:cytochrome P450 [Nocardia nova]AHH20325.1 putative cytochrome P450 [Nocardia nova SH22a]
MTESVISLPTPGESVFDTYDRIRSLGAVVPIALGGVSAWAAVSHRAVSELLAADGTLFSKNSRNCPALHDGTVPAEWPMRALTDIDHMLNMDGAEHRRLRKTIGQAFTPARVAAMEPRIRQITDELIDGFASETGEVDLIPAFTTPLPVRVICDLFGVEQADEPLIRDWVVTITSPYATGEQTAAAMGAMTVHLTGLLAEKRRNPGDDLTSALLAVDADDELTDEELVNMLWVVITAGHETTVYLLSNAIVALCGNPVQLDKAITGDRWRDVVEEALRYRSPLATAFIRYALEDVTIAGVDLPAGAMVVWYGGVGRDPEHYPDATVFDIDHDQRDQLAFGRGPHFCLGAPLARLESAIALQTLFGRFPKLELACDVSELSYGPQFITSGPQTLPVRLRP